MVPCKILVTNSSTDESPNHGPVCHVQHNAIHGKTVGLVLGFPILLKRISFPEKKDTNQTWKREYGQKKKKRIVFEHDTCVAPSLVLLVLEHVNVKSRLLVVSCLL